MTAYDEDYKGLLRPEATLPAESYLSEGAYNRDLKTIWYRQWVYVCRAEELDQPRDFRLKRIGNQEIIVLRDENNALQAFHNTCRHRGSVLLTEPCGSLRGKSITCPYHAWSYSLQGELKRTPTNFPQADFEPQQHSLFTVSVRSWQGFIFINLDGDSTKALEAAMDFNGEALANWPLAELRVGHSFSKKINCNWKVFWENFSECLHCPGIHPELSQLVPLYKRSMMERQDDPQWKTSIASEDPRYKSGLTPGAESWTLDGKAVDETFAGLNEDDIARGHTYETLWPTMFLVGHVDHARIVHLIPLGPETTEVSAHWLFRPETLAAKNFDPADVAAFATMVLEQDGKASELNQKGLRSIRYQQGSLMAEEYEVHAFQNWVREQWRRGSI